MKTIITTGRGVYRCTRYFDRIAQTDHILIEKRRTFLGIPIGWRQVDTQEASLGDSPGELELDARFCVNMYEEGLFTSAMLKNLHE